MYIIPIKRTTSKTSQVFKKYIYTSIQWLV